MPFTRALGVWVKNAHADSQDLLCALPQTSDREHKNQGPLLVQGGLFLAYSTLGWGSRGLGSRLPLARALCFSRGPAPFPPRVSDPGRVLSLLPRLERFEGFPLKVLLL